MTTDTSLNSVLIKNRFPGSFAGQTPVTSIANILNERGLISVLNAPNFPATVIP